MMHLKNLGANGVMYKKLIEVMFPVGLIVSKLPIFVIIFTNDCTN